LKKLFLNAFLVFLFHAFASMSHAAARETPDEAVAMVKKAVQYLKTHGKEKAFAEFSNPKGQFVDRNLYVFVYDMNGTNLAIGQNQRLIGKNLSELRDADGVYMIKNMLDAAKKNGKGWNDYKWTNPATQVIEAKSSYFEKVDDVVIGCGIYK